MFNSLIRSLIPYGSVRRVVAGPARGMRFVASPGIGASYWLGRDAAAPRVFRRMIKPGDTVIDVGANQGQMTLLFASLVGASGCVIAYEPGPSEFAALTRNVALNGLRNVRLINAAVDEQMGTRAFEYSPEHPTQGRLASPGASSASKKSVQVLTAALDALIPEGVRPSMIKVDAEGGGVGALRGARGLIASSWPQIYIELHSPEEQAIVKTELISRGYEAWTLDGRAVIDPTSTWATPLWCRRPE